MGTVIQAVFEKGVFRPLSSIQNIPEHTRVLLSIVPGAANTGAGAVTDFEFDEAGVTPELLQEVRNSIQTALSNVRDPEVMRQAAERMDRAREELHRRTGLVDVVMPILREIRDGE